LPSSNAPATSTQEVVLLPKTLAERKRLVISPLDVALDGGFQPGRPNSELADLAPTTLYIAGREEPASPHTKRRQRATDRSRNAGSATSNAATG
jgi:hypothetical protein